MRSLRLGRRRASGHQQERGDCDGAPGHQPDAPGDVPDGHRGDRFEGPGAVVPPRRGRPAARSITEYQESMSTSATTGRSPPQPTTELTSNDSVLSSRKPSRSPVDESTAATPLWSHRRSSSAGAPGGDRDRTHRRAGPVQAHRDAVARQGRGGGRRVVGRGCDVSSVVAVQRSVSVEVVAVPLAPRDR